jgi:putative ABC transport system ATP-binding protein
MTSIITADGVCKDYVTGPVRTSVLRQVAMSVPEGSFAVLVGPSGYGKSTLLNLIGALDTADAGQLLVAGTALHRASTADLMRFRRAHVSFVFQFYQLLPTLTARENVEDRAAFAGVEPESLVFVGLERAGAAGACAN